MDGRGEVVDETGDLADVAGQCAGRITNARIVEGNDGVPLGQFVQEKRIPRIERSAHAVGQDDGATRTDGTVGDIVTVDLHVLILGSGGLFYWGDKLGVHDHCSCGGGRGLSREGVPSCQGSFANCVGASAVRRALFTPRATLLK
ncbi:hypothetical protein D9M68_614930 [compost metagenome]